MGNRVVAAVALGSNLGDRRAHLDHAASRLRALFSDLRVSTYHETRPVAATGPLFLNAAVTGYTALSARALLDALLEIEAERGRQRPFPNAPRTLDLDLVIFGSVVSGEDGVLVPHPRFRERRFVLEPLAEIAPDLLDPVTGRTMAALLAVLSA